MEDDDKEEAREYTYKEEEALAMPVTVMRLSSSTLEGRGTGGGKADPLNPSNDGSLHQWAGCQSALSSPSFLTSIPLHGVLYSLCWWKKFLCC